MRRIFSHPVTALVAGLCLRLYFILQHPADSGDMVLYDQMATNWLRHHVYAMSVNGVVTPVDLRMPGYPAFLAVIYAITRSTWPAARLYVMSAQAAVDLCGCLATAALAGMLALLRPGIVTRKAGFRVTLWLAALCPFTANYTAVPLTEVFAVLFTAGALAAAVGLLWEACGGRSGSLSKERPYWRTEATAALATGLLIGMGTLFRPETPLLLVVVWILLGFVCLRKRRLRVGLRLAMLSAAGLLLPLAPWAVRNAITLHEVQFLAPKNSNLPGELVPYGFMAWEKTWLFRMKDCYVVPWRLNGETINLEDIPERAFDTPEEKERVGMILEQYNTDVTLSPEEDAAFGRLAQERTARHPLRTYLWLPIARAFTMWFAPRIELLPFSGSVFPIKESWQDDPVDFSFTLGFSFLNVAYVVLALWGAWRLWSESRALGIAVALLAGYILLRTAFLTTLETPEPRYVLECFPAILALAGQIFVKRNEVA